MNKEAREELKKLIDLCIKRSGGIRYVDYFCLDEKVKETGFCKKYPDFCRENRVLRDSVGDG